MITADTGLTANEGYTAGSHTLRRTAAPRSAMRRRRCARSSLAEAARRLGHSPEEMKADNGTAIAPDGASLPMAISPPGSISMSWPHRAPG